MGHELPIILANFGIFQIKAKFQQTLTLYYMWSLPRRKDINLVEFGCKSQLVSLTAGYKWVFHVSINMPWTKLAAATKQALIIWYGDVKELHLKHVSKTWKMMNRHFHFILISIYSCNIWEILKKSTKPAFSWNNPFCGNLK